ncbi:type II secretion system F family protein [Yersinia mollaretii]|uniref:Type II secretion system protein F n=1 Tax=Yersinia mollaretii TaxID=33060 RepID=A0AA36LUJ4_YERMO|nr:type II secretion system F family protein [Yersinia mollaretii]MDA5527551.1 type II secretion system F family protein [Yersinia mollaretii]MDA5535457.1 type II secretion system F family protein [Yersinia mollaretii]MDR7875088.1 type II secretion system F family protein [Yersinia mollaretii]PHZ32589.1 type II secretion system protein F [Yersinia mollaretii]WQC74833.1 type II secretion system F family protein [Yersinia mollaretii]
MFDFLRRKAAPRKATLKNDNKLTGLALRFAKWNMDAKTRMGIYEKLGKFIANGVPITQALAEIHLHLSVDGTKPNNPKAQAVEQWRRTVLNGQPFARALQGWAPKNEISLLEAGEISGRFDQAVQDVLFVYTAGKRIRSALAGLVYPLFLMCTTGLYMYIFGTQVVPAFDAILPKERWQGTGHTMALMAEFVQTGLLPLVIFLIIMVIVILSTMAIWTGKIRRVFDRFPPWSIYRLVIGSNFLISFSALLNAGISVPDALQILARNASPWYRERLLATRLQMLNGARNIGDALHRTGLNFPSWEMIIDIRSYSALAGFDDMLNKLSREWLDDAVVGINRQLDVFRNVAIVIMGLIFMWLAAGMFELQQQLSDAATR